MIDYYIHRICEDITDAIIMADTADAVDTWLLDLNITLSGHPADPAYSVFSEFYRLAQELKQEYRPQEIGWALGQFLYQQREGRLFLLPPFSNRTEEIKMIKYCLQAIEDKKDLQTAFRKWID